MRLALVVLSFLLASGGCVQDAEYRAAAEAALDEASIAVQSQAIIGMFIEMAATAPSGVTPEDRATDLAANIDKLLDCGTTTVTGAEVDFVLEALGCELHGRAIGGTVTFDMSGDPDTVTMTWSDLSDGGLTLSGTATVTWDAGDTRQIEHTGTFVLNADSSTLSRVAGSESQVPSADGVRVSGSRCAVLDSEDVNCWTAQGLESCAEPYVDCRTVESVSTELVWALPVPLAGAHRVTLESDGWDRRVDLSYTSERDDSVDVSTEVRNVGEDQPRSTFQFEVVFP
ncbi:MAG: hypothetical protein QF464_08155 [Myxococcota bacterium]|nr:hypothetical protein [Myxococcota bacterium]